MLIGARANCAAWSGGEGACGALCASLAAEHAQPHHSGSTGDGWAQAADEDEEEHCPGCSSCGGASGSGGQGEGERALQWTRRRGLACRTLAALAYRHADNQHAIRYVTSPLNMDNLIIRIGIGGSLLEKLRWLIGSRPQGGPSKSIPSYLSK